MNVVEVVAEGRHVGKRRFHAMGIDHDVELVKIRKKNVKSRKSMSIMVGRRTVDLNLPVNR